MPFDLRNVASERLAAVSRHGVHQLEYSTTRFVLSLARKRRSNNESLRLHGCLTCLLSLHRARPVLALVLRVLPHRVHPTTVTKVLSLPRTNQATPSTAPHLIVWSTRGSSGTDNVYRDTAHLHSNKTRAAVLETVPPNVRASHTTHE